MNYKFGLVSVSFRKHSPEDILKAMNTAGLKYIEWGSDVHVPTGNAEKIALLQEKYGILCSSYGTYFRLGEHNICELDKYISTAKVLGTRVLRLWCGTKSSENYTEEEKNHLFCECQKAAELAKLNDVVLCLECHNNTYTDKITNTLELMKFVNSPNFRMYWQPNQYVSEDENINYAKHIAEYTEHIHVFNWNKDEKYPLILAEDIWKEYLGCFDKDKTLLLEFMPTDSIESLGAEADSLKKIAGGMV